MMSKISTKIFWCLILIEMLTSDNSTLHIFDTLNAFLNRFARAYHLRGLLFHGMGEHRYVYSTFDNLWKGTLWIQCYYPSSHDPVDHLGSLGIYGGRWWWIMGGNKLSCEKGKWEIQSNLFGTNPTCDLVSLTCAMFLVSIISWWTTSF